MGAVLTSRYQFRLLGPFEVVRDGAAIELPGGRARALLAILAVAAGRRVTTAQLIDELWGDEPPRTAKAALQGYVSQLRRWLGGEILVTYSGGYRLEVDAGALDLARFETLVAEARELAGESNPAGAAERLRQALSLWRGPALGDLVAVAGLEGARLEELRLAAIEERIDCDLALGHDAELVGELKELVGEHPLRERLVGQLMLALYRAGRQADALDVYRAARRNLVDELGIEPRPELRALEHAILAQNPRLDASRRPEAPRRPPALGSMTPLVGRERELRELGSLLGEPYVRLLTLTGPGGIGKSRLAFATAERLAGRFTDGSAVVLLAGVRDPELVGLTIARALGVSEHLSDPILERLETSLAERNLLLLLDNFEQVLDAAPLLVRLLGGAPGLKLLVTSRALLRVSVEQVYAVGPLDLPEASDDVDRLAEREAVRLFVSRAAAASPRFVLDQANAQAVAGVCARVEGMPLALELAAARTRLLTPAALLERLALRLPLLTGGPIDADARHRTLRATIDWSHELLDGSSRELFEHLGVFAGGFTLDAAETVCPAQPGRGEDLLDRLAALADSSLLERRGASGGEPRFAQLEIVREYARERLAAGGKSEDAYRRHAEYFYALAQRAEQEIRGTQQPAWLERLEAEHDNLRAALEWSLATDPQLALALAGELRNFWDLRGYVREAERWLEQALIAAPPTPTIGRVKALRGRANVALCLEDLERAAAFADEALRVCRELGDESELSSCYNSRGSVATIIGDYELAEACYAEGAHLARRVGNRWLLMLATINLGNLLMTRHDYERAFDVSKEALSLAEHAGDRQSMSIALLNLATCCLQTERVDEATEHIHQALAHSGAARDRWTPIIGLELAAGGLAQGGRVELAATVIACAERLRHEVGRALEPCEFDIQQRTLALLRARMHDEAVAAAWARGEALSLDEAMALVLGPSD
jgi:predicted ATPase/DNA-binding SARP family transcriptional activator